MNDGLRIGARSVTMALRFETGPKRLVVVDFTVKCYPDSPILVGHGIAARGRKVDDGKTAVAKPNAPVFAHIDAGVIGSAMSHRVPHPRDERIAHPCLAHAIFIDSTDAAHRNKIKSQWSVGIG